MLVKREITSSLSLYAEAPPTHPPRPAFPPAAGGLNEGSFFSYIIGLFSISSVIDLNSWGVRGLNFRHLALWWWRGLGVLEIVGAPAVRCAVFCFIGGGAAEKTHDDGDNQLVKLHWTFLAESF